MLTPEQYDRAEQEARHATCNRIIEASACEVFNMRGYPTRVSSIAELWRYADCMQENRTEKIFNRLLQGLTEEEFELVKKVSKEVFSMTGSLYMHPVLPTASLLWSILGLRNIKPFLEKNDIVFEVGGGSGYLGVLLGLSGYRYASMDVCQGFYIWQSNLMELFFKNDFIEMVYDEGDVYKNFTHIPYFCFYKNYNVLLAIDCVTANDMVTEMSWESMQYMIKQSSNMLKRGSGKLFYVQGVGLQHKYTFHDILTHFDKRDLIVDYADKFGLTDADEKHPVFYWMTLKEHSLKAQEKIEKVRAEKHPITFENLMEFYKSFGVEILSDDEKFYNYWAL